MRNLKACLGVCIVLLLAACSAPQAAPTEAAVLAAPTATTSPTNTSVPASPTPANTPTEEVAAVDNCIACHTDKDQLILTGKPEEVKEEESEGAG
jgi:mono/diheme cytochrome c family protein